MGEGLEEEYDEYELTRRGARECIIVEDDDLDGVDPEGRPTDTHASITLARSETPCRLAPDKPASMFG